MQTHFFRNVPDNGTSGSRKPKTVPPPPPCAAARPPYMRHCCHQPKPPVLTETTRPRPLRAPRYTVSMMSMSSCLSVMAQVTLLLFPVPRSIMMCLLRKKNMVVQASYSSYISLKSGTSLVFTTYTTAKFFTEAAMPANASSICMQVGSASLPKRITTTRLSSLTIARSTSQPECRCGSRYDMAPTARRSEEGERGPPAGPSTRAHGALRFCLALGSNTGLPVPHHDDARCAAVASLPLKESQQPEGGVLNSHL